MWRAALGGSYVSGCTRLYTDSPEIVAAMSSSFHKPSREVERETTCSFVKCARVAGGRMPNAQPSLRGGTAARGSRFAARRVAASRRTRSSSQRSHCGARCGAASRSGSAHAHASTRPRDHTSLLASRRPISGFCPISWLRPIADRTTWRFVHACFACRVPGAHVAERCAVGQPRAEF